MIRKLEKLLFYSFNFTFGEIEERDASRPLKKTKERDKLCMSNKIQNAYENLYTLLMGEITKPTDFLEQEVEEQEQCGLMVKQNE